MGMDDIAYCFDTPDTSRIRYLETELRKARAKIRKLQGQVRLLAKLEGK